MDTNSLRKSLACYGQEHVMQHWDGLDQAQREHLYSELNSLNFEEMKNSYKDAMQNLDAASEKIDDLLQPLPPDVHGGVAKCDKKTLDNYQKLGLQQIGNDKVAVLLLAGGQGTRLGVPYPKGMYNVGLLSNKTLYQLQAERVLKVQRLAQQQTGNRCKVPWYIMTSEHTKAATDSFFQKHKYFGLQKDNIVIFEQNLIPCLTFDGKLILDRPDKIARAPDGNGGLYRALKSSGVLADMESRGIQYIHVYCVDNILVRMADPHFIGFCVQKGADCGAKVVEKVFPTESVGVVCKVDGIYQVVEYSEITQKTAERRNSDGSLTFNAGNICNHFFSLDFLKKVSDPSQEKTLKYHVAKKKIPFVDQDGQQCIPSKPNGIKMEKFVFDVFQFATNFAVWEVRREDEFSPLKNSDGEPKNTPTTCREALFHLHHRFITAAGGAFTKENGHVLNNNSCENGNGMGDGVSAFNEHGGVICEISPLVSYAGEGLEEHVRDKVFVPPLSIAQTAEEERVMFIESCKL